MKLRLAPQALADVDTIITYLKRESPAAAGGFEMRLQGLLATVKDSPSIGRLTGRKDVRLINATPYPYLLFYRTKSEEVVILRVLHGARNPRAMPAGPR